MSQGKRIQAGYLRGMIEGIEEVAGVKGRDLVLRHAGLEEYIDDPPPMSEKEMVPVAHYVAIERAFMKAFGKGSRPLLIYAGEEIARRGIEDLPGVFASAMRFVPGRLKKQAIFKVLIIQASKHQDVAPEVQFEGEKVIYSNPGCPCDDFRSDEPICHYREGALGYMIEWATGKKHSLTEVKCKAMGDEACVYEIVEA